MTEIAIVAGGSRGDVQPYVALGKGLKDRGYDVRMLATENFEALATEADLDFYSTGENVELVLQSEEWRKTLESGNFLKIVSRMQREMSAHATEMARIMPSLLKGSDLIITGAAGLSGVFSISEMLDIPIMQAYVFPFTPTREFPSPLVPNLPLGQALNRLSFRATRQMLWQTSKAGDAATRAALGLKKGSFWGPFRSLAQRETPALYGYSSHVLPRPDDWPGNVYLTGYWFLDAPNDWTPPADLMRFLEAGTPPVYIGFGSMSNRNPQEAGQMALEALARSGQRGILASGWGGLEANNIPHTVHLISSIPHSWLFPRMAAVVHHGGAGTTAAGLRAGIPSITVPFFGDQPFWGQRIKALGVGTEPIPRKKLTSEKLANAISTVVSDTVMQQRAHELGHQIQSEDGLGNAIMLIEQYLNQSVKVKMMA